MSKRTATLAGSLVLLVLAARAGAACAPHGMLHIVTSNVSPGIADDSIAAQPVVLYRSGAKFARLEQPPDAANRTHTLYVTNAPDAWIVNLFDGTGTHIVDRNSPPRAELPVFSAGRMPGDFPTDFTTLEYGCESAFFAAHKATLVPYAAGSRQLAKHEMMSGAWQLILVTDRGSETPQALLLTRDEKVVFTIRYELYEQVNKPDPALFAKPVGVGFKEP